MGSAYKRVSQLWKELLSTWKTAEALLKGTPKSGKLIVLGVFLLSIGAVVEILVCLTVGALAFIITGSCFLVGGLLKYVDEIDHRLLHHTRVGKKR